MLHASMQAASFNLQSVLSWLTETKKVAVHEEWLRACVDWILTEETVDSEQSLRELVYDQWLHADLKDVVLHGCIPECVARQQKGQIRGRFILQVLSAVDVSRPAYGQLQKLKGKSLDEAEPNEKTSEPKANRLLLLELSDGVTDLQAMEYQPLTHISLQHLLPGTKLMIQGEIQWRLGVLLLTREQVQVLGGRVEHQQEANSQGKVLARLLNDESLAAGVGGSGATPEPGQTTAATDGRGASGTSPPPGRRQPPTSSVEDHEVDFSGARGSRTRGAVSSSSVSVATSDGRDTPQPPAEGGEEGSDFVSGEVDFDDFEDFDDEGFDAVEEMDVPGHDEWPDDHVSNGLRAASASCSSGASGHSFFKPSCLDSHSSITETTTSKSKLSLKQQKSAKVRVCEVEQSETVERRESQRVRNPPVATVKPIQQKQLPQSIQSSSTSPMFLGESELFEEPVTLRSVYEVENNSWKHQPFVKIKAHFVRVCEMLDHSSGEWRVTVMVADDQGSQVKVQLSDKILETLIGFSAVEFRDHINPHKSNPRVKMRAVKGFARCQSGLQDLDCFFVMTKRTADHPCVIQLLDH